MQFHQAPDSERATGLQMRATGILLALNQADYVQVHYCTLSTDSVYGHAIDMLYLIDIIDVDMA